VIRYSVLTVLYYLCDSVHLLISIADYYRKKITPKIFLPRNKRQSRSSAPYISKTLMSFVKTIKVFFTFPRLSESVVLQRQSRSSAPYISKASMSFVKTIKVFFNFPRLSESVILQRQSSSSAPYISRLSESFAKTIIVFFTFQRLQCLLSRLSKSTLHFKDYQCLLLRLSKSPLHFKDFNVFWYS